MLFASSSYPQILESSTYSREKFDQPADIGHHPRNPDQGSQDNFAAVNHMSPNYTMHSLFRRATPIVIELNAGEALYMPAFTFHFVESLPSDDVPHGEQGWNMGINMWTEGDARIADLLNAITLLLQRYPADMNGHPEPYVESQLREGAEEASRHREL